MKKRLTAVLLALAVLLGLIPAAAAAEASVPLDEDHFPDAVFRGIVAEKFDTDGDGSLSPEEIGDAQNLFIRNMDISSAKGVEYLTGLTILCLYSTDITELDVSKNVNIHDLECSYSRLKELDLTGLTKLNQLSCQGNRLTELDLSPVPGLIRLNCDANLLTELDLSPVPYLQRLDCEENQLTGLDLSPVPDLDSLFCDGNQLQKLDFSPCPRLFLISCSENQLTDLDLSMLPELLSLKCGGNRLSALDLSGNPKLEDLWCGDNLLTVLNLENVQSMQKLDCSRNRLQVLDVSGYDQLIHLHCGGNQLTGLEISEAAALEEFTCTACCCPVRAGQTLEELPGRPEQSRITSVRGGNFSGGKISFDAGSDEIIYTYEAGHDRSADFRLTCDTDEISVSSAFPDPAFRDWIYKHTDRDGDGKLSAVERKCVSELLPSELGIRDLTGLGYFTSLEVLDCSGNELKALDLSGQKYLKKLSCQGNRLDELQVTGQKSLQELNCSGNRLEVLDLSGLSGLIRLDCTNNYLCCLDIEDSPDLNFYVCSGNTFYITSETQLSQLPGSPDPARISAAYGGSFENGEIYFSWDGDRIDFSYQVRPKKDPECRYLSVFHRLFL